jgi:hypothetical protein
MKELQFFMDISPKWWVNSSKDESAIKKYICDQFEYDYYPRIITLGRQQIDLDKVKSGEFIYEFLPEDETLKENYIISNGNVSINPEKKLINSRILIKI